MKNVELELEVESVKQPDSPEGYQDQEENNGEQDFRKFQRVKKSVLQFSMDDIATISSEETQHSAFRASEIVKPTIFCTSSQWKTLKAVGRSSRC